MPRKKAATLPLPRFMPQDEKIEALAGEIKQLEDSLHAIKDKPRFVPKPGEIPLLDALNEAIADLKNDPGKQADLIASMERNLEASREELARLQNERDEAIADEEFEKTFNEFLRESRNLQAILCEAQEEVSKRYDRVCELAQKIDHQRWQKHYPESRSLSHFGNWYRNWKLDFLHVSVREDSVTLNKALPDSARMPGVIRG